PTDPSSAIENPKSPDENDTEAGAEIDPRQAPGSNFPELRWFGLHHYSTDGRNIGMGIPLVGTSWLNRPYYVGGDIGPIWLTRHVSSDISTDTDLYGGVFGGWDWDYYWGTELAVHRATPELINSRAPDADRDDRLMEWTACLMYYPWGDAVYRPYWRCGIGATQIDFPTDSGHRRDEALWTFPVGIGLKYPLRHWLAARVEFADQIALGNSGVATQHDLTLTFGLEWRFGAHPRSYWPWNPSRHIW
ncbi:MAG TPA: outer membrane beta-barrel protein, partial [Lacipirellulaceae bacterium]|nr:outer membrane beta-barrel protein [Lacipirellulaceae bacterium]